MSEKSEALRRIADLEAMHERGTIKRGHIGEMLVNLRFLHAENEELRRERDEARRTVREAHEEGARLTAQRDALLDALKRALPHAEDSMSRPELDIDILDARVAIKAVEEGK